MGALGTAGAGVIAGGVAEGAGVTLGPAVAGGEGSVAAGAPGFDVVGDATGGATGWARVSGGIVHGTSPAARIQREAARVRGRVSVRTRIQ